MANKRGTIKMRPPVPIHETVAGYRVFVVPGTKTTSRFDFIVKYQSPTSRPRKISHVHLIVDMLQKRVGDAKGANRLADLILTKLIDPAKPAVGFPPVLRFDARTEAASFVGLNEFGEYEAEFILAVEGLIAVSEKTNYPFGILQRDLWRSFRDGADTYSLLSRARYGGGGRRQT